MCVSSFRARLGLVALLGLAVRLVAARVNRDWPVVGDALTFHLEGGYLAQGQGFRRAFEELPTAEHPPAHIVVLAVANLLGIHGTPGQKLFLGGVGTITVVLIGLLGRRVAGDRAGLLAAALAAVYPMLFLPDAALMSETTSTLLVVVVLLAGLGLADRRTAVAAAGLGASIALAALARGEVLGLLVLLAAPLAWRAGAGDARRAAVLGATCLAAFALVLAPWTIRNARTFARPVLLSTNGDAVWVGANCPRTYDGDLTGAWVFSCFGTRPPGDEAQQAVAYRARGLAYARAHAARIPAVVVARLGRLLDVFRPWQQGVFFAATEGRKPTLQRLGLIGYWLLLPFGAAGIVVLRGRRDGTALLVLLAPVALVILVGAVVYGSTRFRATAEPALVVAAAVALDAALRRVRGRVGFR